MDAREKLLGSIEKRLTVYADWVNQGGGIRSEGAEYLYCDLLNVAFGYELKNMNRIRDNFPAIDLGDGEERLAVQVTSTGDAAKVKKTLERFYTHKLDEDYDRLIVVIAGKAECKGAKFDPPGLELQIWGTAELLQEFRDRLSMKTLKQVDEFLQERVDAPKVKEPLLHLPVPERRNPVGFLGRKAELAWIGEELKKGTKPVIVAGLGGVGKTALAVEFRKGWAGNVYFAVFRDSFTRTLAESVGMAIPVQERQGLNEEQTAALALGYLSRCEEGDLLIVDNAEVTGAKWSDLTKDPFYQELRRLPMAVLMTTRHRDTGGKWLGRLAQDDLREIFRRHEVKLSVDEMDRLIDAVDGHTMTVDMIARTIRESWGDVTAEKILTAMADSTLHEGDFDEIETDHDPEQRQIYAHLRALFDLSGISDDGRQALRCATLLPQNGMDEALFRHALTDGAAQAIKLLEKKGWVDRKEGKVTIHPVVRLVCRTELKPKDENCEEFLTKIESQYDQSEYSYQKYRQIAELFTEASSVLEDRKGICANHAGNVWFELGVYTKALQCNLLSAEKEKKYQLGEISLASSYCNVGSSYMAVGDYEKALEYMLMALRMVEQDSTKQQPNLAAVYHNAGYIYGVRGEYDKALKYKQKNLEISKQELPENHPDLAFAYHNLGLTYGDLGKFEKTLECEQKSLSILEQAFPADHPNLAKSYSSLGNAYDKLGKHEEALVYGLKALTINEQQLPADHPDLASSYSLLSYTYGRMCKHGEALDYDLKALAIREEVLPANHPDLAVSYANVGHDYCMLGKYMKALEYGLKGLHIRKQILPANHPELAQSYSNVSWVYYELNNLQEAAKYMRQAAQVISNSELPEKHPKRVRYLTWANHLEQRVAVLRKAQELGMNIIGVG